MFRPDGGGRVARRVTGAGRAYIGAEGGARLCGKCLGRTAKPTAGDAFARAARITCTTGSPAAPAISMFLSHHELTWLGGDLDLGKAFSRNRAETAPNTEFFTARQHRKRQHSNQLNQPSSTVAHDESRTHQPVSQFPGKHLQNHACMRDSSR